VANRRCHAVLYAEHASGSLRSEPLVIPTEDPRAPRAADAEPQGFLVLSQTHALDSMLLRTFSLPLEGARAGPVRMEEPLMRGWSWFPPQRDAEKLVFVTDAGVLGLFGVKQAHNDDSPLFPLVRTDSQPPGLVDLPGDPIARGRAQVAHALENDLWVLAEGRLQRQQLTFDRQAGPRAVPHPSWSQALALGSPLHESQIDEDGTTLFLVTQPLAGQTCLATAVDAETGKVRWQRQLGLVCQGEALTVGNDVLTLDQGGGLFLFDPARHPEAEAQWQTGGLGLAKPLGENGLATLHLLPSHDGKSAYEIANPASGKQVIVRHHVAGRKSAQEQSVKVAAPLAGTPALGPNAILLPLEDGSLVRVALPLSEEEALLSGEWRASRIATRDVGHAAWLGGNDFLTTNGQDGLTRWRFKGKLWETVPAGKDARDPTLKLPARVASAPVVLREDDKLRVVVADVRGTLHLFEGDELKPARQWALPGKLTAGPFVRGGKVGCVVDRRRLVWIDPGQPKPVWNYLSPGEGIVGQPQLVEGLLVVADLSGRFVGLDPATGAPAGAGYFLKASVTPAASPVAFGAGRVFAPLTDGTVLLLPLERLR
jgi:hypothetical protein